VRYAIGFQAYKHIPEHGPVFLFLIDLIWHQRKQILFITVHAIMHAYYSRYDHGQITHPTAGQIQNYHVFTGSCILQSTDHHLMFRYQYCVGATLQSPPPPHMCGYALNHMGTGKNTRRMHMVSNHSGIESEFQYIYNMCPVT
jgi:hypothetical protein